MTTRTDFSPEQWEAIRNAPQLVALATAAAGNSGLFGSLSEGMAVAGTVATAVKGDQPLLREIFAKDEMQAAQEQIKTSLKSVTDRSALNAQPGKRRHRRGNGGDHRPVLERCGRGGCCLPHDAHGHRQQGCQCFEGRQLPGIRRRTHQWWRAKVPRQTRIRRGRQGLIVEGDNHADNGHSRSDRRNPVGGARTWCQRGPGGDRRRGPAAGAARRLQETGTDTTDGTGWPRRHAGRPECRHPAAAARAG
jgi:hypothetical protein